MGRTACTEPQCLYKGALYLTFIFSKNPQTLHFFKIYPVVVEFFHADGQTDGYDETRGRISQFYESTYNNNCSEYPSASNTEHAY